MLRTYIGHPPPADAGWERLDTFQHPEAGTWEVHRQQQPHSPDWGTYKVFSTERVPGRANYWFTRNDSTSQIGFGRDLAMMRTDRPELHRFVLAAIGEA